jgi:hypothetical protein
VAFVPLGAEGPGPSWNGAVAEPETEKDCVPPGALSVRVTVALRVPAACGANVTFTAHVAFTATGLPTQVLVCEKSPGFGPAKATPVTLSGPVPVLVTVIACGPAVDPTVVVPVKVKDVGVNETNGAAAVLVPDNASVCGLVAALSVTCSVALNDPALAGLNVTVIEQFAFAASVDEHVFVCPKLVLLVPLIAIELIASDAVPLFVSVNVCGVLFDPAVALNAPAAAGKSTAPGPLTGTARFPVITSS